MKPQNKNARLFTREMAARNDDVTKADDIQKKWLLMKETWFPNEWYFTKPDGKSKSAEDKHTLDLAKKEVYTAMLESQESMLQGSTGDLQSGRKNCFMIARQMARDGRDVISVCCMKIDVGNVVSDAYGMKNISRKYMEKLLNVENDWDDEVGCPKVMGP